MARVIIPITDLVKNSSVTPPSTTAADGTNHHYIAAGGTGDRLFVEATAGGSAGNGGTVTIKAGANPPGFRAGLGDLDTVIGDGATKLIGPLESARFAQADGTIYLNTTSFVGTFRCYRLP